MLVVDTGGFLAAADRKDPAHPACRDLIKGHPGPLVTTALVVAETGWLINRQLGPATEAAFYLDHRHFRVVRPRHVEAFELLP